MRNLAKSLIAVGLLGSLAMTSCKDKEAGTETETLETEAVDNTEVSDDPVMDTVVTEDDTIVKTGGGENKNPAGDQVP